MYARLAIALQRQCQHFFSGSIAHQRYTRYAIVQAYLQLIALLLNDAVGQLFCKDVT